MAESKRCKDLDKTSEPEQNIKLTEYFRRLLKREINFRLTKEELCDIICSVDFVVETLVATISSKVGWLQFSRVVKVGSMAEGTSVGRPNEFDYLAVLKIEAGSVQVERTCAKRRGYAHVKIADPNLKTIWGKWMNGQYLTSDFTRGQSDFLSGYFDSLGNAFKDEIYHAMNNAHSNLVYRTKIGKIEPESSLNLDIKRHGPAFTPKFVWKSKNSDEKITIEVDITLAIEVELTPDIISETDTFDPLFFRKVKEHGKVMLISCRDNASCDAKLCMCLVFTEIEVELVRNMGQHHKECYKLLKYIFNDGRGYTFLPSYVLKTLVLKHNCHCEEEENLAVCFKTLVASCLHYLFNRKTEEKIEPSRFARALMLGKRFSLNIPSIFFKEHNILYSKNYKFPCEQFLQEIEIMLESIEKISYREEDNDDDESLDIVTSIFTGVEAYLSTFPFFRKEKELTFIKCYECYGNYFNENIL
ncbi:uncharacterized protein LOC132727629 [Ruditapes philippinarum]|uniref:uncharacterized protein LOC132727629 n=1 Tax=Ruditapes philippinarum TaxID=129788 RepID=UPI00295C3151|nr:uncharacterized protein LOC132727629 [Ruditapes philippinarum]